MATRRQQQHGLKEWHPEIMGLAVARLDAGPTLVVPTLEALEALNVVDY